MSDVPVPPHENGAPRASTALQQAQDVLRMAQGDGNEGGGSVALPQARGGHGGPATPAHEELEEPRSLGIDNRKLGIWTLLGSEIMFFSSLIITYIVMRDRSTSGLTPREALNVPLTAFNTFVLICSSMTMVTALDLVEHGNVRGMRFALIATALLGLLFLGGQTVEFTSLAREGLGLGSNLFGATFFTLTGFHGAHVFAGVVWIVTLLVRAFRGGVTPGNHLAVEMVGLYWHFVDLVWIIIFTIVYLI